MAANGSQQHSALAPQRYLHQSVNAYIEVFSSLGVPLKVRDETWTPSSFDKNRLHDRVIECIKLLYYRQRLALDIAYETLKDESGTPQQKLRSLYEKLYPVYDHITPKRASSPQAASIVVARRSNVKPNPAPPVFGGANQRRQSQWIVPDLR
jgi:hypothetical protein